MIIASTPLRISLFGGSTETPAFIEKYGRGTVVSFATNLKTYVTVSQDTFGFNRRDNKYIVNYSRREEVTEVAAVQNDLVRGILERFATEPVTISLTSDVFSQGGGLASSSYYLISLTKAVSIFNGIPMTDSEICSAAYAVYLAIYPYCGLQVPYGCGLGGFKRLAFGKDRRVSVEFLPTNLFDVFDLHLIFTGVTRESKGVLEDVSRHVDKAFPLLELVALAYEALYDENFDVVLEYLNRGWEEKKSTSSLIAANPKIREIDTKLAKDDRVLAHKLCGAGNGGFFLCFTTKESVEAQHLGGVKVTMSTDGTEGFVV